MIQDQTVTVQLRVSEVNVWLVHSVLTDRPYLQTVQVDITVTWTSYQLLQDRVLLGTTAAVHQLWLIRSTRHLEIFVLKVTTVQRPAPWQPRVQRATLVTSMVMRI